MIKNGNKKTSFYKRDTVCNIYIKVLQLISLSATHLYSTYRDSYLMQQSKIVMLRGI